MVQKILVVEDDVALLKLESILLTYHGYEVRGATSGEDALQDIEAQKPDLVLLDIMLPDVDGYEICRELKNLSLIHI